MKKTFPSKSVLVIGLSIALVLAVSILVFTDGINKHKPSPSFHSTSRPTQNLTNSNVTATTAAPLPLIYRNGRSRVFLNLPYAIPKKDYADFLTPAESINLNESLRLRKAKSKSKDYEEFNTYCPQVDGENTARYKAMGMIMDIDCLTLNIFAPLNESNSYPVYVLLHGDSLFARGSSADFGVRGLVKNFVEYDIVVVTISYRVGMYGLYPASEPLLSYKYQSTPEKAHETELHYGPLAILDQILALQWIHKYIANFQGDQRRLTLGGFSGGACSVSTLALASQNVDNLFLVIQSGSYDTCRKDGLLQQNAVQYMKAAMSETGKAKYRLDEESDVCSLPPNPNYNESECVHLFVKKNDVMGIEKFSGRQGFLNWQYDKPLYGPIPDDVPNMRFGYPRHPIKTLKVLMGISVDEWAYFDALMNNQTIITSMNVTARDISDYTIDYIKQALKEVLTVPVDDEKFDLYATETLTLYTLGDDHPPEIRSRKARHIDNRFWYNAYIRLMTDAVFTTPMLKDARIFTEMGNEVFLYKFAHRGPFSINYTIDGQYSAFHGADQIFAHVPEYHWWPVKVQKGFPMLDELKVAKSMRQLLVGFIKNGTPHEQLESVSANRTLSVPFLTLQTGGKLVVSQYRNGSEAGAQFLNADVENHWNFHRGPTTLKKFIEDSMDRVFG